MYTRRSGLGITFTQGVSTVAEGASTGAAVGGPPGAVVGAAVGQTVNFLKILGGLFRSSDPVKDKIRNALTDQLAIAAVGGDATAYANLACRAGELLPGATSVDLQGGCALEAGSTPAREYAQQVYTHVKTQLASLGIVPATGTPGAGPRIAGLDARWLLAGAVGLVLYQLYRR